MNEAPILLVDDEEEILKMITIVLQKEGFYRIETATSGMEALYKARQIRPQLIVLDVMLPDGEGFDICAQLRRFTDVPILFLTARTTDLDKLKGFQMGGDDYITKPFQPLELSARIQAQIRRMRRYSHNHAGGEIRYQFDRFEVNETAGMLIVEGKQVACPAMEFRLLCYLCASPNKIFSKRQLYEKVWGEESLGDENTVMVHIRRLREKIEEDPGNPKIIVTVRGLGYKLVKS